MSRRVVHSQTQSPCQDNSSHFILLRVAETRRKGNESGVRVLDELSTLCTKKMSLLYTKSNSVFRSDLYEINPSLQCPRCKANRLERQCPGGGSRKDCFQTPNRVRQVLKSSNKVYQQRWLIQKRDFVVTEPLG